MLWSTFARRYMFSPKSHSVINIIAFVSLIAVAVPTAAMIILLGMFAGLSGTIEELSAASDADIEIVATRGSTLSDDSIATEDIASIEGVEHVATYVEQSVIATAAGRRIPIMLRGVDSAYFDVIPVAQYLQYGRLESVAAGDMILGAALSGSLAAYGIGTQIELYALNRKQLSTLLPTSGISRLTTRLGGVVNANAEINSALAITDIGRVQRLLNYDGRITAIIVDVNDNADIDAVERSIESVVGTKADVLTREEQNASMNAILRMEKYAIVLIGLMIALVATFAIVGSVIMLITEKQRDIATLRAIGANRRLVRNIFVGEGLLLTLSGVLLGTLIGVAIALGQQYYGWVRIPGNSMLESYPVKLVTTDLLMVIVGVTLIGWAVSALTVRARLKQL
ncbi:MAG: ABC transporter permease [Alistipes sp.]|nr:ABC transporter permease [Alistipes sp.]